MEGNTFWGTPGIGPIFINIFLSNLFLVAENVDFASYTDGNTIYDADDQIDEVIFSLQESSKNLFKWFADNQMKTNEDKFHLIVSTNKLTEIKMGDCSIKNSRIDLIFYLHFNSKCFICFNMDKSMVLFQWPSFTFNRKLVISTKILMMYLMQLSASFCVCCSHL